MKNDKPNDQKYGQEIQIEEKPFYPHSDARVRLLIRMIARLPILIPLGTPLVKLILIPNRIANVAFPLQKLHAEALTRVPRNVAVHDPEARVVGGEGDEEVAAGRKRGRVATGRVVELQARRGAVPDAGAGSDDVEVVAVEVDGVGEGDEGAGLDPPEVPLGVG